MGLPTKYEGPKTCKKYIDLASKGKTDIQIAAKMGVTTRSIQKWAKQYPEFASARILGKEQCEAWWMNYFQEKGTGENYNKGDFQAARWITMNKFGWSDKSDFKLAEEDMTIKIEIVDPHENK